MYNMYGFKTLEKKYGIKVREDGIKIYKYTNETRGITTEITTLYKIYSADGCMWENGLSEEQVKAECERWSKELLKIKKIKENLGEQK